MKLSNLLIMGFLIIPLISTSVKADIIIKTVNGTVVETSGGKVKISAPNGSIPERTTTTKDDYYSTSSSSSSSGKICSQKNTQRTTIQGSNRTVVHSSISKCE
jgi:hypothetical protein